MDWKQVSVTLGIICLGMVWPAELLAQETRLLSQASGLPTINEGQPLDNTPQSLPLPQANPNLQNADQILQQTSETAQQQSAQDIIRSTQDAALLNDDYVGSPDYFMWTDGEADSLDYLGSDYGAWGEGLYPYSLGY